MLTQGLDFDGLKLLAAQAELEEDYALWLATLFPDYCTAPLSDHHVEFWEWVWAIEAGVRPDPLVCIWPRGSAKSTSAEMACVALGARFRRRYGILICSTQDQANDHVGNVASMLESKRLEAFYPQMADRLLTKFGHSKGWKINRLRTASGFTLDAMGLDAAARGAKLDDARPDWLVFDDVDSEADSLEATDKKVRTITRKILPAGSSDVAVLAIQNLVIAEGVFARLAGTAEKPADFLANRRVIGPVPAVEDLSYVQRDGRYVITGGTPTWAGQDLVACQSFVDDWGISAFLSEAQHDVEAPPGGMFDHLEFARCSIDRVPQLVRTVVWVDPAVTNKDSSDCQAIQADGLGVDGRIYRLRTYEARSTPRATLAKAIRWAMELGATTVGVETDQGGDTWQSVWREALQDVRTEFEANYRGPAHQKPPIPSFKEAKAGEGHGPKVHRAAKMLADYERPGRRIVHVEGTHLVLERALKRFPKTKPLDCADCAYWAWLDLREGAGRAPKAYTDLRGLRGR